MWRSLLNKAATLIPCCLRLRFKTRILTIAIGLLIFLIFVYTKLAKPVDQVNKYSIVEDPSRKIFPKTLAEQNEYEQGFSEYAFNAFVSDRLDLQRPVPDTRHAACRTKEFYQDPKSFNGLTASVIVCFHNEAKSVLKRTIHSIVNRSPPKLLHEIILLDDKSDNGLSKLDVIHISPKIRFKVTSKRLGLIRARNFAANSATGKVLVFLDSHVEVNVGWLEPLIFHLNRYPKSVAIPMVDIIDDKTFAYRSTPPVVGGFDWELNFVWEPLPPNVHLDEPFPTPVMSGGLLAVRTATFHAFGGYDDGMETWGGENLEMSFRFWQCGGSVFACPCSRVGHVFRGFRPYGDITENNDWLYNSLRLARVWMGPFRQVFYLAVSGAESRDSGDLSSRFELQRRLKCRSFKWYLNSVGSQAVQRSIPMRFKHLLL